MKIWKQQIWNRIEVENDKILFGVRGIGAFDKKDGAFTEIDKKNITINSNIVEAEGKSYQLKADNELRWQLPCGFIDAMPREVNEEKIHQLLDELSQDQLYAYLRFLIYNNTLQELSEEFLDIKKLGIEKLEQIVKEIEILGFGEMREIGDKKYLSYSIVKIKLHQTDKQIQEVWGQEENRGSDWLELPKIKFLTPLELKDALEKGQINDTDGQLKAAVKLMVPQNNTLPDIEGLMQALSKKPRKTKDDNFANLGSVYNITPSIWYNMFIFAIFTKNKFKNKK